MEAPALLLVKLLQGVGQNMIGATVPVGAGIIAGIVAWAAGFILVPFLGYRNAADHHVADVMGIHLLEQLVHALAFLEEVHVMQVGVGIDILRSEERRVGKECRSGRQWAQELKPMSRV